MINFPVLIGPEYYDNYTGDLPWVGLIIEFDTLAYCPGCDERIGAYLQTFDNKWGAGVERPVMDYYYIIDDKPSYLCEDCFSAQMIDQGVDEVPF